MFDEKKHPEMYATITLNEMQASNILISITKRKHTFQPQKVSLEFSFSIYNKLLW